MTEELAQATARETSLERSFAQEQVVATESGRMSVPIRFRNDGEIAYKLADIAVVVNRFDAVSRTGQPLITMPLPAGFEDGIVLGPGIESAAIPFAADNLNVDMVRDFLRNPTALFFEPTNINLVNEDDTSFVFLTEDTFGRTGLLIVDNGVDLPARFRVATNVDRDDAGELIGVPLGRALTDAEVDFETETATGGREVVTRVGAHSASVHTGDAPVLNDPAGDAGSRVARTAWVVIGARPNGLMDLSGDVTRIRVANRDEVRLVFLHDEDRDGVFDREEFLYGSSDDNIHSDANSVDLVGDDLSDFFEIRTGWQVTVNGTDTYAVYPSPLLIDSDDDGLNDREEFDAGTDPWLSDTDLDGRPDADEIAGGTDPLQFTNEAPTLAITNTVVELRAVEITLTTDDPDGNIERVVVNWGDGESDTVVQDADNPIDLSTLTFNHTFAPGSFTITATATDIGDLTSSDTVDIEAAESPLNPLVEFLFNNNTTQTGSHPDAGNASNTRFFPDRDGTPNAALSPGLRGGNNGESAGIASVSPPALGSAFTFTTWIQLDSEFAPEQSAFMGQRDGWSFTLDSNGVVHFGKTSGAGFNFDAGHDQISTSVDTNWSHIAGVVDGAIVTLYKDGVQVDTTSFGAIQSGASACRFHVGTRLTECISTTPVFIDDTRAFLDDVRVYDRALTANEVAALANL